MTNRTSFPSQQGFAWRGDWKRRLQTLLSSRGFTSASEFAATRPTKSFVELAEDLGPGDVAAVQLQWSILEEAKTAGNMEPAARGLLVRCLHDLLPAGWDISRVDDAAVMPRVQAISAWSSSISSHVPEYTGLLRAIGRTIMESDPFPTGWLPADANDPLLVEFFQRHWVEP
jgi:hypothetical protein